MKKTNRSIQFIGGHSGDEGDLDKYFDYFFGAHRPAMMPMEEGWHPAADLFETEKEIVIIVDIAGIQVKDVNLVLHKDTLKLAGVRRELTEDNRRQYHKMEVAYGPFERLFRLPQPVEPDNVTASYKDGFLSIRLVKCSKNLLKKKMTIKIR